MSRGEIIENTDSIVSQCNFIRHNQAASDYSMTRRLPQGVLIFYAALSPSIRSTSSEVLIRFREFIVTETTVVSLYGGG